MQDKATHGQGNKSSGGSSSGEDGKSSAKSSSAQPGSASAPQVSSSEGGKSNTNVSPDINSCSSKANAKNNKKTSNSYHGNSGNKSSGSNMIDNKTGENSTSSTRKHSLITIILNICFIGYLIWMFNELFYIQLFISVIVFNEIYSVSLIM